MKEVVWIFGSSSVGKKSFIANVTANQELAGKFGWNPDKIAVCTRSVDFPGDISLPETVKQRKQIPDDVEEILKTADVVLIKWQYADSELRIPQKLQSMLPEAKHRIIVLQAADAELIARLNKKDWWKQTGLWGQAPYKDAAELLAAEKKRVPRYLDELHGFEITAVDSGTNEYTKK